MMTREMVLELLATAGEDLTVDTYSDGYIVVTVEDFEGFDEHWSEVDRVLDDEDLVESIYETLEDEAQETEGDFYQYFQFEGFTVRWGYASYDI